MKLKKSITLIALLFFNLALFAQENYNLSGTVLSQSDNSPIPGVNVIIKGSSIGSISDFDGNYQLSVKKGDVIVLSYLGFKTKEISISGQNNLTSVLQEDASALEEVVVVGYGTQKKSTITGAISKVTNEKLDQVAVSRVDEALIGQVSGVNIQTTNAEAGAAPKITIRGFGSISGETGPALVVDGIVVDSDFLSNLDMNDIESFEVLKDAASAAIYGSEGANGVIIISTKEGKVGKTKFSYKTYFGSKEAHQSDGYKKSVADWAAYEAGQSEEGVVSERTQYMQLLVDALGVDRDWQDVFFNGGNVQSHSFSARGGSKDTKFSTSLRSLSDEGVVITDSYNLYSANVKVDSKLNDRLKVGITATPSYSKRRALPTSIHNPIRQSPWLPIYHTEESLQFVDRNNYSDVQAGDYFYENHLVELDLDGDGSDTRPRTSGDSNPYAQYVEREHFEYKTKIFGKTYLEYKIDDHFKFKTQLGVTLENRKRHRYDGVNYHANGASRSLLNLQNQSKTRLVNDNLLTYTNTIGNHDINVLLGLTFQERRYEESMVTGTGFTNDLVKTLNAATAVSTWSEFNETRRKIGYFARLNYAFKEKYLLNASVRRDGSSVFGVDSKWGTFPAVSLGWNAHKEEFLLESDVISVLKLRASYGLTGNENFSNLGNNTINRFPYISLLDSDTYAVNNVSSTAPNPSNLANTALQWEANKDLSVGIDYGFFNNTITGSVDWFQRESYNLLLNNPVGAVTGFYSGIVNIGQVANTGLELEIKSRNIANENFKWTTSVIATTLKNELVDFADSDGQILQDTYGRNTEWINASGNPISSFYGYVVDDTKPLPNEYWDTPYFPINGKSEQVIVKDLNGDGIISDSDKTVLGDPYPDLVWSMTNDFKIKNFDLSFMIQGSHGSQVRNVGDQYFYTHWQGGTIDQGAELAVQNELISHPTFLQDRVLTNDIVQGAGYLSLRNVNVGYSFPKGFLSKFGLESLRLYATGQNLIYYTMDENYHGFNPEHSDSNTDAVLTSGGQRAGTPQYRTMTLGLNIDF
ncbi:MAG: TonB-dependent receptor [Wenyingzhuangia sp.]|uniref:SusC/RagA family TonB-linked outer membrane protein n=2 Tax=Wenyingzhuangia sp. TaxID=1964193 RepID=UPI00321BA9FF